jgi:hypothetical protein
MTFRRFISFALAGLAGFALTLNAYTEASHTARLGGALALLIVLHLTRYPRFWVCREFTLYLLLAAYMSLELLWTHNLELGLATLMMSLNFMLISILFAALVFYHDLRAVLAGTLCGFLAGAALYTFTQGFPFVYPVGFSYNSIAGMYLFGLFVTMLFGWYMRWKMLSTLIGIVLLLHIAATTSIKTNLGILLGAAAAAFLHLKVSARALLKNAIPLAALAGAAAYAVVSNDALLQRVNAGFDRVAMGATILIAREDVTGTGGLGIRESWLDQGIEGWGRNPLFGHGVEAFREDFGVTSHSTPVDLLYNSGLIGCALFYAIFVSIGWRLIHTRGRNLRGIRAFLLGGLVCYAFISLSGTLYYDTFLAAAMAISVALLRRLKGEAVAASVPPCEVPAVVR